MKRLIVIVSLLITTPALAFVNAPKAKSDCMMCHMPDKTGTKVALKMPIRDLCLSCHPEREGGGEHRVGVAPKAMKGDYLPLDKFGKMTCVTCHEPHGMLGLPSMLRARPGDLCSYCHDM